MPDFAEINELRASRPTAIDIDLKDQEEQFDQKEKREPMAWFWQLEKDFRYYVPNASYFLPLFFKKSQKYSTRTSCAFASFIFVFLVFYAISSALNLGKITQTRSEYVPYTSNM